MDTAVSESKENSIRFLNRYTGEVELEEIYGEGFLRWVYGSPLGKAALHVLVKRAFFSKWYGWRMDGAKSKEKIIPFIDQYGVDTDEFADEVESYGSFNDFFYRKLKPAARSICDEEDALAFPADGRHLPVVGWGSQDVFYAKGQAFDLPSFLGDEELANRFSDGDGLISRLCPTDYHRFHSPVSGKVVDRRKINGALISVNPIALRQRLGFLWENKREMLLIETDSIGLVAYVAIGATCVGGIEFGCEVGDTVSKGDELGFFTFGGSCVATFYEGGKLGFDADLLKAKAQGVELYAKVGDRFGMAVS